MLRGRLLSVKVRGQGEGEEGGDSGEREAGRGGGACGVITEPSGRGASEIRAKFLQDTGKIRGETYFWQNSLRTFVHE